MTKKGSVFHEHDFVSGTCTDASANRVITNDGSVVKSVSEYNKDQGWLMVDLIIGMIEIIMALLILKTEFIGIQKVKKPIIGDSHL